MTRRIKFSVALALALCAWWAARPRPQNAEADAKSPRATVNIRGFLETYCYACHDSRRKVIAFTKDTGT